jgi:hypothetical protein
LEAAGMSALDVSVAPGPEKRTALAVKCPSCGGSITLRALGQSVMVACPFCRSQLDVSRPDIQIIRKYREKAGQLDIPLGTRGVLRNQMFEVVGAMQRSVEGYSWREYLLFNPYIGFRWLVLDSGHWSLGRMLRSNVSVLPGDVIEHEGRRYRKFQQGRPAVDWVIGEFYWRVAVGDRVKSSDYVSPPFMLSLERSEDEQTWTRLEYIEPEEVAAAFGARTSHRAGVSPNQPNPVGSIARQVIRVGLVALVLAVVIQGYTASRSRSVDMSVGTYSFFQDKSEQVFGPFTFDAPFSLNELKASASLRNSWAELDCTLVETKTGKTYEFTNAFSYYYGSDSDGAWSEGKPRHTSAIANIPAGTYNLVVDGAGGDQGGKRIRDNVSLFLRHDVTPWQNFWIAVLIILSAPIYLAFRSYSFEKERWADSDFNPYSRESE